ncbi:MAG: glycoside hydrolase family 2 protein [Aggregatilineales bacterium]
MKLNSLWKMLDFGEETIDVSHFCSLNYDDSHWISANVPGDIHSSLLATERIPDPFYDSQVDQVQWVEARTWIFRKRFPAIKEVTPETRYFLRFNGLDLFANVYLNGIELGEHANMFRPAEFDVTQTLHTDQDNLIIVKFDPLRSRVAEEELSPQMPEYDSQTRVQVRKAQAQFMWDHTPTCLMVGIWQDVLLEQFEGARLKSPHFRILSLDKNQAVVGIDAPIDQWMNHPELQVDVRMELQPKFSHLMPNVKQTFTSTTTVENGIARTVMVIPHPVCWYPNGYGESALYDLNVTLRTDNRVVDSFVDTVGIRTIRIDQSPDPDEVGCTNFTFVVNDVPIFAKGANWVPTDLFNGRVEEEDYREWLLLLKEAHGNMLRIWGGGQYEPESFYRIADELGILIWHDFMFSGASYPENRPDFYEEVRKEAEYQVTRLRNRPSMAIWCGNNELDWHLDEIQWDQPGAYYPGKNIMHKLLPQIVNELDPDCFYWPSSPYGGNDHNGSQAGDKHNWQTWHAIVDRQFGEKPKSITEFEDQASAVSYWHLGTDQGRFISEFGIHGSPIMETLRRNIPEKGLIYNSPEMIFRNRNIIKDRGDLMMQAHIGIPTSLDDYIDYSMMVQAEGLKYGLEHYRRRKFHCSGALFWQWNDNWPSITWSVLDYYRFPKAGYFFVKRAFAPVMLSVKKLAEHKYTIWGTNDTLADVIDTLTWTYMTFDGEIHHKNSTQISITANTSCPLINLDNSMFENAQPERELLWLHSEAGLFPDNRYFLAGELRDLKREKPEVQMSVETQSEKLCVSLRANAKYAYFVNVLVPVGGVHYSDNWIDLCPNETRVIEIWHKDGKPLLPESIQLRWR